MGAEKKFHLLKLEKFSSELNRIAFSVIILIGLVLVARKKHLQ